MAKRIDGKTYNKITGICDQLMLLNNKLADTNSDVAVAWDVFCDGIVSISLIDLKQAHPVKTKEWFFRDDGNDGYNAMIDQINEWEAKYASA